jgi:hypothetical protein
VVAGAAGAVVALVGTVPLLVAWCVGARLGVAVRVGVLLVAAAETLPAWLVFPVALPIAPMTMSSATRLPSTVSTL